MDLFFFHFWDTRVEERVGRQERELHAIRLDNEAAWAKEDLLRE
ncbi:unnamed protein product [Coffea canephora]|uniref:Uncharacterized protein n=1 Tax=Coffea canephora TaxID=49390 RepID=A0A068VD89_COFCA|nr:unnamed protein product [Coffea canephora]